MKDDDMDRIFVPNNKNRKNSDIVFQKTNYNEYRNYKSQQIP